MFLFCLLLPSKEDDLYCKTPSAHVRKVLKYSTNLISLTGFDDVETEIYETNFLHFQGTFSKETHTHTHTLT